MYGMIISLMAQMQITKTTENIIKKTDKSKPKKNYFKTDKKLIKKKKQIPIW